jgi:hypothetical protein
MWLLGSVAAVLGVFGATYAAFIAGAAYSLRRQPCPGCATKLLRHVATRRMFEPDGTHWIESLYRCLACQADFFRRDKGPLVPRHLWTAGMRDGIPTARLLDR